MPVTRYGENAGQDQVAPAIPGAEAVDLRGCLEVRGNGRGAGDDVEEDVPLRAEEHQEHGGRSRGRRGGEAGKEE